MLDDLSYSEGILNLPKPLPLLLMTMQLFLYKNHLSWRRPLQPGVQETLRKRYVDLLSIIGLSVLFQYVFFSLFFFKENVELKAKVMRLEDELENLKTDYTEREGQIAYLKDKIDKLEAEQPDQLINGTK